MPHCYEKHIKPALIAQKWSKTACEKVIFHILIKYYSTKIFETRSYNMLIFNTFIKQLSHTWGNYTACEISEIILTLSV